MTRVTASMFALALLAGSATAKPPQSTPPGQAQSSSNQILVDGLNAVAATAVAKSQGVSPQSQPNQVDHDQGDDHASLVAISKVCNHDNPSATHSAICPKPNSPP